MFINEKLSLLLYMPFSLVVILCAVFTLGIRVFIALLIALL
jgi:hypothetical protein